MQDNNELMLQKPIALVAGEPVDKQPTDLFIPPDALQVFLSAFEGPLDLLLYLIRKHKFDILDLPISRITEQYMEYVDLMKELNLDLAAEYLLMAAILAQIKSKMLLPVQETIEEEETDPRAELVKRLQEYESYKRAALDIEALPRLDRDYYSTHAVKADNLVADSPLSEVTLKDLSHAFTQVMKQVQANVHHHIQRESLSTRARMSEIMDKLSENTSLMFWQLFNVEEGRAGAVVSFLAILQLCKEQMIGIALASEDDSLNVFLLATDDVLE
ncbi:MAG: segregation and condensation protein A [Psychrobium sp.]